MAKNIILCSDGTGKSGGINNDTNVFKLYKAIDSQRSTQYVYYDDGIGSSGNKYVKFISGAFGFGFERNILNLYRYLVKHYEPGDKVYMFGFSRGAATIRAIAGMIETVGLIRNDAPQVLTGDRMDDIKMILETRKALYLYRHAKRYATTIEKFKTKKTHGVIDIEMIGVWDTVSALGFPQDSTWLIILLSKLADKLSNYILPHHYFNYQLNSNVINAYQALAIDDDRFTFHPKVWNEVNERRPINIEQVWFAGAHANVGGGYPRTGLSMITLDWMITKAKLHGIKFHEDLCTDVKAGINLSGKIYNPRDGVMIYYRFSPRHIRNLCMKKGKSILTGNIKIHRSVFDRIRLSDYAPILPNKFEIVDTNLNFIPIVYEENAEEVKKLKGQANLLLKSRTWLYHILTELSVLTGIMIGYFNVNRSPHMVDSWAYNIILSVLPEFSDNFLYYCMYENKLIGLLLLCSFIFIFVAHKVLRVLTTRVRKRINWWLLKSS